VGDIGVREITESVRTDVAADKVKEIRVEYSIRGVNTLFKIGGCVDSKPA